MKTKKYMIILSMLVLASCTNPQDARKTLIKAGYSDIKTHGYAWFSCGRDDSYQTKFTAKNPIGIKVSGVVCSGLFFKSSTIRF